MANTTAPVRTVSSPGFPAPMLGGTGTYNVSTPSTGRTDAPNNQDPLQASPAIQKIKAQLAGGQLSTDDAVKAVAGVLYPAQNVPSAMNNQASMTQIYSALGVPIPETYDQANKDMVTANKNIANGLPAGGATAGGANPNNAVPGGGATGAGGVPGSATGSDATFSAAVNSQAPTGVPSKDSFYNDIYTMLSPAINALQLTETAAESAANIKSTQATSETNAALGARGLAGSSEAGAMVGQVEQQRQADILQAKAAQATAIGDIVQKASTEAYKEYSDALARNDSLSQAYIKQKQTELNQSLSGLASTGVTLDELKQTNPVEYQNLLQYAGGDPNALNALYISASSANLLNNGQPITTSGNSLVYGVKGVDANGNITIKTITTTIPDLPTNYKVSSYNQAANGTVTYVAFPTDASGNQTVDPTKPNNGIISGVIGGATAGQYGIPPNAVIPPGVNANSAIVGQGIIDGKNPPVVPRSLSGKASEVQSYTTANGFDLSRANLDWVAMTKYISTLNSSQQIRLRQAAIAVPEMLNNAQSLYNDFYSKAPSWGITSINSASLKAAIQGVYGSDAQAAAVQLNQQITDITSDLGTIYKGGNSATDQALQSGAEQLSGSWDADTFTAALDNINKNIKYRINAIQNAGVGGTGTDNPYATDTGNTSGTNTGATVSGDATSTTWDNLGD